MSLIPSDIQAVATLATNIAIVISLLVLATNVYLQRKSTKYNTYEKLMSDFSGTASILIDRPEILEIYVKAQVNQQNGTNIVRLRRELLPSLIHFWP